MKKSTSSTAYAPAPALVQRLTMSFLYALSPDVIERAHAQAVTLLTTRHQEDETIGRWVEGVADAELEQTNPAALGAYKPYGGDIQNAFMEPSFCLGFSLAYLLFHEGRAR